MHSSFVTEVKPNEVKAWYDSSRLSESREMESYGASNKHADKRAKKKKGNSNENAIDMVFVWFQHRKYVGALLSLHQTLTHHVDNRHLSHKTSTNNWHLPDPMQIHYADSDNSHLKLWA
ncbi:uncharacterized protein LOC131617351 [Vicia villosa]|uniref:uncharacterized protein LOC131617351 n=1 Tax=Vicia villosa TaxID=3911 RepID=UPI00273BF1A3|nr:uncharacterized protein LOC131617351 [Vicia villosa]